MRILDIEKISERLFECPEVRQKLCRDYCIEDTGNPIDMAARLVESLGQTHPQKNEKEVRKNNSMVFRAAALALASNMGTWSRFLDRRGEFEFLLENYNPAAFSNAVNSDRPRIQKVAECLGKLTGRKDAEAIKRWALLLGGGVEYYGALEELRNNISKFVCPEEVVPVLAAFLGSPKKRAEEKWPPPSGIETWKTPGMEMALASEFLRNLHWEGFKPDRHIKRLLGKWFYEVVDKKSKRAKYLAERVLCTTDKKVIEPLTFSLVGVEVTPVGCNYTKADNLVWALGAYVETKKKESDTVYWKTISPE